jgi:hypothetical protein
LVGIELGEGVHQPHHAGRDQVLDVHMLGQPLVNAAGQKAHDGQMLEQHRSCSPVSTGARPSPPGG